MPLVECQCGAQFSYPERLAGRRVKCKRCEQPISLPETDSSAPDEGVWSAFADEAANAATQAREQSEQQQRQARQREAAAADADNQRITSGGGDRTGDFAARWGVYWKDVMGSLFLIANPSNLGTVIVLGVLGGVQPLLQWGGCIGAIASLRARS